MAAVLSLGALPVEAQQSGLVNVTIHDVELLNDLQLAAPINVQVPIGIAANVCNIDANVLAAAFADDGAAECTAKNTTQAFRNLVARNERKGG